MLERAGFFRELRHGDLGGPSLVGSRARTADSDEGRIVSYLSGGALLATTGMAVGDFFDDGNKNVAQLGLLTDGVWVWPTDLAYYVRNYHVCIPDSFVKHMREQNWAAPAMNSDQLRLAESELFKKS